MLKYLASLLFTLTLLEASGMHYAVSDKHSFVLPKNSLEIKTSYFKVNNTLDVLNLKKKQFSNLGSIGDMDGYSLELRYGISSKDSIFVSAQKWNINYGDSVLKNNKYSFFNRYELIKAPYAFFNSLSFDVGFEQNSANPIMISSDKSLNALIKKIKPSTDIRVANGRIYLGNLSFKGKAKISIKSLKSKSYFGRILIGKKISSFSLLDFYIGYKYTKIQTDISFDIDNNFFNKILQKKINIPNLNRSEKDLQAGFSYLLQEGSFIYEFNYEFNKLFRDADVSYLDTSHTVDASISMKVTKNTLVYVGGKLMMEQFNSDIPYLYNRYTKTQFDHKYGFAKFGLVYKFK